MLYLMHNLVVILYYAEFTSFFWVEEIAFSL